MVKLHREKRDPLMITRPMEQIRAENVQKWTSMVKEINSENRDSSFHIEFDGDANFIFEVQGNRYSLLAQDKTLIQIPSHNGNNFKKYNVPTEDILLAWSRHPDSKSISEALTADNYDWNPTEITPEMEAQLKAIQNSKKRKKKNPFSLTEYARNNPISHKS